MFKEKVDKIKENWRINSEINNFRNKWEKIMVNGNVINKEKKTFSPNFIKIQDYGYSCRVYIPHGFTYEGFEKVRNLIEDSFPCILIGKKRKNTNYIECKIITKNFENIEFEPPKTTPFELYMGRTVDGKAKIINMSTFPNVLITGCVNSGKSKALDHMMTTLVHNTNRRTCELYLVQVAKNDLTIYKKCEQTRFIARDLESTVKVTEHILKKIDGRNKMIEPLKEEGLCNDTKDWNKKYPQKAMSSVYLVIEEFSALMPSQSDDKETKLLKASVVHNLELIAQYSRSVGIYLIVSTQRPTKDKLPTFVKANCTCKVSFRQTNKASSEVATDDGDIALGLDLREAVIITNEIDYIKTDFMTDDLIMKYIKDKRELNKKFLNLDLDLTERHDETLSIPHVTKKKTKKVKEGQTFDKVTKNDDKSKILDFIEQNKKDMPEWVEWEGDKK